MGPEHPAVATALNNLATLYQDQGDYARAIEAARRSNQIRTNIYAGLMLSVALVQTGAPEQARTQFELVRRSWPTFDVRRYADIVIARQCAQSPLVPHLQRVLRELAAVTTK